MSIIGTCTRLFLAAAASAALVGCTWDSLDVEDTGSGEKLFGHAKVEPCKIIGGPTPETAVVECDIDGARFPATITGSAGLLTAEVVNAMYDPLILELPATAVCCSTYFQFTVPGSSTLLPWGPLDVKAGLTSIPIDAKTSLVAEPGKQLVIVDIPKGVGTITGISLNLQYVDLTHSPVKVIFAAKVTAGGTTYYPPLLPCVADFAGIPAVSVGGLSLSQAAALLASATPCDHKAYDFGVSGPPPGAANYQGLWWKSPADSESGWGLNLAHQGDTIFASWFTYDMSGRDWWVVMTAPKTGPNTYAGKLYQTRGPAFNAPNFDPATVVPTEAGSGTLTFTDANNGTFSYTIGTIAQAKSITREQFGALPSCSYGTQPNLALATNYQDLWWAKPAASESGWGINLNHEGDTIFATWFTYDLDNMPLWLVVTAAKTGAGVYTGDLYQTSGARFDAFNPGSVVATKVGSATFTFADGNNASFKYTVQLPGMASAATQTKAITRELFSAAGTTCR